MASSLNLVAFDSDPIDLLLILMLKMQKVTL